jgi:hypothetical protein
MRLFFLVALLSLAAPAQTRTVTIQAAAVVADVAQLEALPDGGCAARWCGQVVDSDGQTHRECTARLELRGAVPRSRCADVLNAGVAPVRAALRFAVDGGAP